jgi:hypothetical protein
MPGSRSRRDVVQSILLVAAALVGLVAVRSSVAGGLSAPLVSSAPTVRPVPATAAPPASRLPVAAGTRLSLGGRKPVVVDPSSGSLQRIASAGINPTSLFRQGSFTVLLSGGHAWAVPAGQAGPRRPLGRAVAALPALAADRVWLVDIRDGPPDRRYDLVEVGLADGRRHAHWTLPYQVAPMAVLRSGVLAGDLDGDLVVVAPGSGRVRALLAREASFLDTRGDRVAWLADGLLVVRDLAGGTSVQVPPPPASAGWFGSGRPVSWVGCCYELGAFDPGGRWLAAYTRLTDARSPGLAIVDLSLGRARLLPGSEDATPTGGQPSLGWASNGWLYFVGSGPTTSIVAWPPGGRAAGLVWMDAGQALDAFPLALAAN